MIHILTKDHNFDTSKFDLRNSNVAVFGCSGSGKTSSYVSKNLKQTDDENIIVNDSKGVLYEKIAPLLRKRGYDVYNINLVDVNKSTVGYNPLDFLYTETDMLNLASCLCPENVSASDKFWSIAAQQYIAFALAYAKEKRKRPTPADISPIINSIGKEMTTYKMQEKSLFESDCIYARLYNTISRNGTAEKMTASIMAIANAGIYKLADRDVLPLYTMQETFSWTDFAERKSALFITVSDSDSALYCLSSIIYTQAITALMRYADSRAGHLPIACRLYMDDAISMVIPHFDLITSCCRSRGLSVSLVLQSFSQLVSMYGHAEAKTILSNFDRWLVLGVTETSTAEMLAARINLPPHKILEMDVSKCLLLERGKEPVLTEKATPEY